MRLFIAEKPSLGRAIADVLPKPHRKGDGFIEGGNGQVVTWCIGHLLEQARPGAEGSRYGGGNRADRPMGGGKKNSHRPVCRPPARFFLALFLVFCFVCLCFVGGKRVAWRSSCRPQTAQCD
ncbi:hypothetical protein C4869_13650 [Salmonella enterica subsp. enterica serovar Anatum]|nr:hypothetical protein C4869_13650 [Salmonella enterica subsp. enterica serovar Anatum]